MKKKETIHLTEKIQILPFTDILFSKHKLIEDIFLCIQQCTRITTPTNYK